METGILHLHSALRYLVMLLLFTSIASAYVGLIRKRTYPAPMRRLHALTRIFLNIQGLTGIFLYVAKGYPGQFSNISNLPEQARFFLVRHLIVMLLGIAICSIGYARAKHAKEDAEKLRQIAIFYTAGFIVILTSIPFPFIQSWAKWF